MVSHSDRLSHYTTDYGEVKFQTPNSPAYPCSRPTPRTLGGSRSLQRNQRATRLPCLRSGVYSHHLSTGGPTMNLKLDYK